MAVNWTGELKERVKELWSTQTATQISALLNTEGYATTRASVIGVIHRMGLTAEAKTVDHPLANGKGRSQPRPSKRKLASNVVDLFNIPPQHSLFGQHNVRGVDALESHHCRYLVNDDTRDPLWCGHRVIPGKSWCPIHAALVFTPREQRRAAA